MGIIIRSNEIIRTKRETNRTTIGKMLKATNLAYSAWFSTLLCSCHSSYPGGWNQEETRFWITIGGVCGTRR